MIGKKEHSAGGSPHTSHHVPSLMFHTICLCRNNWGVTDTMCTRHAGPAFLFVFFVWAPYLERGNWAAGHGQQCHRHLPCPHHPTPPWSSSVLCGGGVEEVKRISLFILPCKEILAKLTKHEKGMKVEEELLVYNYRADIRRSKL